MSRRVLTDRQWAIIKLLVPGKEEDRGWTGADNRLFLDVILWLARTTYPWRDSLPGRRLRSNPPRGGCPSLATGAPFIIGSGAGRFPEFGRIFSRR